MAESEVLKARLRVKEMYYADPITEEDKLDEASWTLLPVTLRDDELLITEEEPDEDPVYSHENDSPEEVDYIGKGLKMTGSFIKATRAQMISLLGGSMSEDGSGDQYFHPGRKEKLTKAFKIVCADDSEIIVPKADGFVNMSLSLGKSGTSKFPFRFSLLNASSEWPVDLVI